MSTLSRRALLKALGLSTAAVPLLPTLEAFGQTAAPAKRLLLVFSPCGSVPDRFWPTGTENAWTIATDSILSPMIPLKNDIIVVNNLKRVFDPLGGDHERGIGCMWTGAKLNPGDQFGGGGWPSGPSIDQIIARALPAGPDFKSLLVGVQPFGPGAAGGAMQHMNYAGSDQPIPSEPSPYKLYEKLYGNPAETTQLIRLRAERKSVIDLLKAELAEVNGRVGKNDRAKIDAHLEATRSIEKRLDNSTASRVCAPTQTGAIDIDANENFPALVKLQSDLIVSAFACDRTRVATLQWSRAFSEVRHTWAGATSDHHSMSHDTGLRETLVNVNRWYMQQLAYLIGELKKVPEGGGTLLDNTLVVYVNELSTGWDHQPSPSPTLLAGGLAGTVKTGRYLDYGAQSQYTHNHLLVTLCKGMGLTTMNQVGNLGSPGALPNLLT